MENYAHTAMICVVIFAAGFNMSDNWAITLNAKYHVPLVAHTQKNEVFGSQDLMLPSERACSN